MTKSVQNILHSLFSTQDNWKIQLLRDWNSIFGNLKTKVQLEKIYQDTLVLSVYDSCWLQELYLLSDILLETINNKLDRPRIKQLRFKKRSIKKSNNKHYIPKAKKKVKPVHFSVREKKALNNVEDSQLRDVLKQFLIRCHQERE